MAGGDQRSAGPDAGADDCGRLFGRCRRRDRPQLTGLDGRRPDAVRQTHSSRSSCDPDSHRITDRDAHGNSDAEPDRVTNAIGDRGSNARPNPAAHAPAHAATGRRSMPALPGLQRVEPRHRRAAGAGRLGNAHRQHRSRQRTPPRLQRHRLRDPDQRRLTRHAALSGHLPIRRRVGRRTLSHPGHPADRGRLRRSPADVGQDRLHAV
jgi:hypothetical protein